MVRHLRVNYKDVLSLSSVDKIFAGKLSLILHKWPISAESAFMFVLCLSSLLSMPHRGDKVSMLNRTGRLK